MEIKFINSSELHCIFTEKGVFWHDFKNNRHLLFPYGSIKRIFFAFGYLFILSEKQTCKAFFSYKEKLKLVDAIEYAKNMKKISTAASPIELDNSKAI